jgi:formylmethanofuran dehydrogenase subunit A
MNHARRNTVSALQWCIGLELFLQIRDPWRVFLTTDHPNGGPFTAYPDIIQLLMDKGTRSQVLGALPERSRRRCHLSEMEREYSLSEIVIISRAGTARALGLENKGHLGPGADADIAIYAPAANWGTTFRRARWVIKAGEVVVRDGTVIQNATGRTLCVNPEWDSQFLPDLRSHFERRYSLDFENYAVQDEYVPRREVIECT